MRKRCVDDVKALQNVVFRVRTVLLIYAQYVA